MRLDHLLSKEEEVGVVLLFSYQGASARGEKEEPRKHKRKDNERIPVAMRLGETPVLIPNTKVKT